jgi:hypothetical protein
MNHEYLWSKTGNDVEVERLEGLLRKFRFDEKSTVEPPSASFVPVAAVPKRRLFLTLSFAASAAIVVLAAIFLMTPGSAPIARDEPGTGSLSEPVGSRNDEGIQYVLGERARAESPRQEQVYFSRAKIRQHAPRPSRPQVTKTKKENLTKEEKYAYDRLMFALSIAGSKLKVVQDTIDRKGDARPQSIRNEK